MYRIFEKDGDTHESEAGEKPQKPWGQRTGVAQNANAVAKTCLFYQSDNTNGFKNCHTKVENCSLIDLFL